MLKTKTIKHKTAGKMMITLLLCGFLLLSSAPKAYSAACPDCSAPPPAHDITRQVLAEEHAETIVHMNAEFLDFEIWLAFELFRNWLNPMWQFMTEQFVVTAMQQTLMVGMFFDAENQLRTQRLTQELMAHAHKDYHPSMGMCEFGTNTRSLAQAERQADFVSFVMSQRSLDRQMGQEETAASQGQFSDRNVRLEQFRTTFCNIEDMAGGVVSGGENIGSLVLVCSDTGEATDSASGPDTMVNTDIDFSRTIDRALTLEIDFSNTGITEDEHNVFALANNLYSHDILMRIPEIGNLDAERRSQVLNFREIVAKRSVAEHSFNTIVGLKSQSNPTPGENSSEYMKNIVQSLGIGNQDLQEYLIGTDRPSYYAQMEVLTKRIYQRPEFFTSLYDKPVNVDRKRVAMEAIGLMQNFDTWESYLRTEAMLSVLLEMEIMKLQEDVQNRINLLN